MSNIFYRAEYVTVHSSATDLEPWLDGPQVALDDFEVVARRGIFVNPSGISEHSFSDRPRTMVRVRDIRDDIGEWVAVGSSSSSTDQDEYLVFGDTYGYCPIFYSFVPGTGLIISDSFYGQVAGLREAGVQLTHDLTHYVATMTSRLSHFQNPSVSRTMAEEIRILPLDKALYVTGSAVRIVSRSVVGGASVITDYDEAVSKGIEFGVGVAKALTSNAEVSPTLFLSGGVDSRLVLAFLVAAEVESKVSVNTVDPRTWNNPFTAETVRKDMEISSQIRQDFGMAWAGTSARTVIPFDFEDSLAYQQSYRSNFGFIFSPSMGHTMSDQQQLGLRGGGGELLRTTSTGEKTKNSVENLYGEQRVAGAPHDYLAKWVTSRSHVPPRFKEEVDAYLAATIKELPGVSVEEIMNHQYLHNRNRTHFGHIRHSQSSNNVSVHLLSNPFLFRAQELSPFSERKDAVTVQKLYDQLAPKLLEYPFESAASTQQLSAKKLRTIRVDQGVWSSLIDSGNRDAGDISRPDNYSSKQRGIYSPYSRQSSVMAYINSGFRLIEHAHGGEDQGHLREVHQIVFELIKNGKMDANIVTSKLASAVDLWYPMIADAASVHLHCSEKNEQQPIRLRMARPEHRKIPSDGWNNVGVVPCRVDLKLKNKSLIATVSVDGPVPTGAAFAFYLYQNGRKITHQWYSKKTTAVFEDLHLKGKFFVRAFVRTRDHAIPGYPVQSELLEVS